MLQYLHLFFEKGRLLFLLFQTHEIVYILPRDEFTHTWRTQKTVCNNYNLQVCVKRLKEIMPMPVTKKLSIIQLLVIDYI